MNKFYLICVPLFAITIKVDTQLFNKILPKDDEIQQQIYDTFCLDVPTLNIYRNNEINEDNKTVINIWFQFHRSIFISKSFIHKNLPDLLPSFPKEITSYSNLDKDSQSTDHNTILFLDNVYYERVLINNNINWRLLGFNQVFAGCPQPFCFQGGVDSAFYYESRVHLFRGRYVWQLNNIKEQPKVKDATPINMVYRRIPEFIDAAYIDENDDYIFFKDDKAYFADSSTLITEHLDTNEIHLINIHAAFRFILLNEVFMFKDDYYYKFKDNELIHGYPKSVKELNKDFPNDIDAIFYTNSALYIFKGYFVIEVLKHNTIESENFKRQELSLRLMFQSLFGCSDDLYIDAGFNSYLDFERNLLPRLRPHERPTIMVKPLKKFMSYFRYCLIGGGIFIIIIIIIIFVIRKVKLKIASCKERQLRALQKRNDEPVKKIESNSSETSEESQEEIVLNR